MTTEDSPFRGGFRFLPGEIGVVEVDVWGSDLLQLLPRAAEAVSRAAGMPELDAEQTTFALDVGSDTESALLESVVANAVSCLSDDGFYVDTSRCRALATADPESGLTVRYAARLVCTGRRIETDADPGLSVITEHEGGALRLWRENDLVRLRFQLRKSDSPEPS